MRCDAAILARCDAMDMLYFSRCAHQSRFECEQQTQNDRPKRQLKHAHRCWMRAMRDCVVGPARSLKCLRNVLRTCRRQGADSVCPTTTTTSTSTTTTSVETTTTRHGSTTTTTMPNPAALPYLGIYDFTGTQTANTCKDTFPQTAVARLTLLMTTATGFAGSLHVDDGDPLTGRLDYTHDVQGVPAETWTTTQIDTCVLFMRPPPRRCGVMMTSIAGLPGDEGAPGTLILQFHDPLKDPDCGIEWTGVWQVSPGAR
jgi:hypothetical protein